MRGTELLNELSSATGLPDPLIGEELERLLGATGVSAENVTLDDLRDMLASYLQEVLLEAKDSLRGEGATEVAAIAATIGKDAVALAPNVRIVDFQAFSDLGSTPPEFIAEG